LTVTSVAMARKFIACRHFSIALFSSFDTARPGIMVQRSLLGWRSSRMAGQSVAVKRKN